MIELLQEIERVLPEGGDWCTTEKANALAALVVGLRPRVIVEIGVWMGGSLVPMLLAQRYLRAELAAPSAIDSVAIAIDPWSADASVDGETGDNQAWWAKVDHERAYQTFVERLDKHGLRSLCAIWRQRSNDVPPPAPIDLLHIDGNHRAQAFRDIERFCPKVRAGGIAVLDDVAWEGGHVAAGVELARQMGFVPMYPLGTGLVMQRRSYTSEWKGSAPGVSL